jgi:hypothetical protein
MKNYHMIIIGILLFIFAQIMWHLTATGVI